MTVCIFAASSSRIENKYAEVASELGCLLARSGIDVVFGGGDVGLMGVIADAILSEGGRITGVLPLFMKGEGWAHHGLDEMIITDNMSERKRKMLEMSDAVVALPGGIGTLEELTEAITLKQLSLFYGQIIIVNTLGFYDNFFQFIEHMVKNNFMRSEHKKLWEIANTPQEVIEALAKKSDKENWRKIARI